MYLIEICMFTYAYTIIHFTIVCLFVRIFYEVLYMCLYYSRVPICNVSATIFSHDVVMKNKGILYIYIFFYTFIIK